MTGFEAVDYHRNGISGDGFYVGIYRDKDGSRKLITYFPDLGQCAVAVLDLDMAAAGNVYMHPQDGVPGTGGNAWRGDHYHEAAEDMVRLVSERWSPVGATEGTKK